MSWTDYLTGQLLYASGVLKSPTRKAWNFVGASAVFNAATQMWDITTAGGGGGGSGDVTGPASSIVDRLVLMAGTTGKVIKQSSFLIGDLILKNGGVAFTAAQSMGGFKLTALATPTAGTDAANKDYVDSAAAAGASISPVLACATGNVALTGAYTVDGRTMTNGERYLAPSQSAPAQNGIYIYNSAGAHARATDMDTAPEFRPGAWFTILAGERFGGGAATVQNPPTILGTDPVIFLVGEPTPQQDETLSRSTADAVGSLDILRKSRGTKAAPAAHAASDVLGERKWQGHDGTSFYDAMVFRAVAEAAGGTSKRVRFESLLHNGSALAAGEKATQIPATTTDATLTTVYSVPVGNDEYISLAVRWTGKHNASSNRAFRETTITVRRSGSGNVVELSHSDGLALNTTDDPTWGDATQIGYTLNNGTKAVDITVKGKAATTIAWVIDVVWSVR